MHRCTKLLVRFLRLFVDLNILNHTFIRCGTDICIPLTIEEPIPTLNSQILPCNRYIFETGGIYLRFANLGEHVVDHAGGSEGQYPAKLIHVFPRLGHERRIVGRYKTGHAHDGARAPSKHAGKVDAADEPVDTTTRTSVQRWHMDVTFAGEAVVNDDDLLQISKDTAKSSSVMTYGTKRSHEDVVASQERDEGLSSSDELPWHDRKSYDCAENLSSSDGEVLWKQARHVCAKRNRVGAEIDAEYTEQVREGYQEDATARSRGPVVF